MTVACIIIKHLPYRVETARHPQLRRAPAVIYEPDSPLQRVVDATPGYCIHPGMPLDTALARCPHAVPIPADPDAYTQRWNAAVARLRNVRDSVDETSLGTAYVLIDTDAEPVGDEPRTVANLMGCVPANWEPHVGVASDRFTAHCAASVARPGHALRVPDAPGTRRRFLSPLSVNLLPVDVHVIARLHDLGTHRLGQLADLSAEALAATVAELSVAAAMPESHQNVPRAA